MRANAITVIHKFIRREMFDFAERLFRAGPEHVSDIRAELERIVQLLQVHAAQEDARLEPLLREVDATFADRLKRDHRRLEDQLESLRHAAKTLDASSRECRDALLLFHLDWNRFLSAYLIHLDDEERTLIPALGDRTPPLSAIAESARQQGVEGEEFLLRLWAVTTCEERAAIEQRST
jgi:hypothetical protein